MAEGWSPPQELDVNPFKLRWGGQRALPLNLNPKNLLIAHFSSVFKNLCIFSLIKRKWIATENICQKFYSIERKGKPNWILNLDLSLGSFRVKLKALMSPSFSCTMPGAGWQDVLRSSKGTFPPEGQKKASAKGQSSLQELKIGPHKDPYLLVLGIS